MKIRDSDSNILNHEVVKSNESGEKIIVQELLKNFH